MTLAKSPLLRCQEYAQVQFCATAPEKEDEVSYEDCEQEYEDWGRAVSVLSCTAESSLCLTVPSNIYFLTGVVGLGGFLLGYGLAHISGVLVMEGFKEDFGEVDRGNPAADSWVVGFIVTVWVVGCTVGALPSGLLSDKFGRRRTLGWAAGLFVCSGALQASARTLLQLVLCRASSGIAVGVSSSIVPTYISELAPAKDRGQLITFNQLAITFGILVAFWVNYAVGGLAEGWRVSVGLQCLPGLLILGWVPFLPESPRWLVQQGRIVDAVWSLRQLRGDGTSRNTLLGELRDICLSVKEAARNALPVTYMFKGQSLMRLLLGVFLQTGQQLTGINAVMYYAPTTFRFLGIRTNSDTLLADGVTGVVNFLATFVAFFWMDKVGRRRLLVVGAVSMAVSMAMVAALGHLYAETDENGDMVITSRAVGYPCLAALYLYVVSYAYSWGPVVWVLCTEIFPTSERPTGVSITTATNWTWNILIAQFAPVLETAISSWLYAIPAGCCAVQAIVAWKVVPETTGISIDKVGEISSPRSAALDPPASSPSFNNSSLHTPV